MNQLRGVKKTNHQKLLYIACNCTDRWQSFQPQEEQLSVMEEDLIQERSKDNNEKDNV